MVGSLFLVFVFGVKNHTRATRNIFFLVFHNGRFEVDNSDGLCAISFQLYLLLYA